MKSNEAFRQKWQPVGELLWRIRCAYWFVMLGDYGVTKAWRRAGEVLINSYIDESSPRQEVEHAIGYSECDVWGYEE